MPTVSQRISTYGARPDISARSLLVTVFGDSIVPTGGAVWLADLIKIGALFGFSDRLIRTSVYRLDQDGWFATEKIGRRSRYYLTERATADFVNADWRIYQPTPEGWEGEWTVIFTSLIKSDTVEAIQQLRWQGFGQLADGVLAKPRSGNDASIPAMPKDLASAPTATMRFGDLEALITSPSFRTGFDLYSLGDRYEAFTDSWAWFDPSNQVVGSEAFAVRTMLVHDFRRIRLTDVNLPGDLLSGDWPGNAAYRAAASAYAHLNQAANVWLETEFSLRTTPTNRFPLTQS